MTPIQKIETLVADGQYNEARAIAQRLKAKRAVVLSILGSISFKEQSYQEAELTFLRALKEDPSEILALVNLGKLYLKQRKTKKALEVLLKANELKPHQEQVILAIASCYSDQDRMAEAASLLSRESESSCPSFDVLNSLANVLRADLRPFDAIATIERAKQLYPGREELEKTLADCYAEIDPQKAVEYFRGLGESASISAKWNRSFVELRLGNFREGWDLYENGLSDQIGKIGRPLPPQIKTLPLITDLSVIDQTKWTLVSTEQGIGDQILFFGCFNEAVANISKVALVCEQRMIPILARSYPNIAIYPYSFVLNLRNQAARFNGIFPIGSLQKYYRMGAEDFKNTVFPYIRPNAYLAEKYGLTLKSKFPGKRLIGLSWSGGYWDRQKRTKNYDFEYIMSSLQSLRDDTHFISLQYGDVTKERDLAKRHNFPITFISGVDFKKQIDNWIAISSIMDHTISVSTALVHFLGAMGKPVSLLLTKYQAPFIWGIGEGPSLPYPSVCIYRQGNQETITEVLERVRRGLE